MSERTIAKLETARGARIEVLRLGDEVRVATMDGSGDNTLPSMTPVKARIFGHALLLAAAAAESAGGKQ